jgi:hypothetical protein
MPTKPEKIRAIRELIATGSWSPVRDIMALAGKWECEESEVFELASEAHELSMGLRDAKDHEVLGRLSGILEARRIAREAKKAIVVCGEVEMVDSPDVKGMLAADRLYLEVLGALVKEKQVENEGAGGDLRIVVLREIESNPVFASQLLSMLAPAERRLLLDSARTVDMISESKPTTPKKGRLQ